MKIKEPFAAGQALQCITGVSFEGSPAGRTSARISSQSGCLAVRYKKQREGKDERSDRCNKEKTVSEVV